MSTFYGISSDSANSLFSNLSANSTGSSSNLLSDYASIKNGSYRKLLERYYAENNAPTKEEAAEATTELATIKSNASSLYDAARSLVTGDASNTEETLKNAKEFVSAYNSLIDSSVNSDSRKVLRNAAAMTNITDKNSKLLGKVGITIGEDNKLSLNEETWKAAKKTDISSLFNGSNSYADSISTRSSNIYSGVVAELNANSTYTNSGSYANNDTLGKLYDSIF